MIDIPNFDSNLNTSYIAALTLGTLIERIPDTENKLLNEYITKFVDYFKITLDGSKFTDKSIQYEFQGYISSLINTSLINDSRTINLNKEFFYNLYGLFIESFKDRQNTYPEAINCIGSILSCKF